MAEPFMTVAQAEAELAASALLNPGPWVAHSRNVGLAARRVAEATRNHDPDRAYVYGLLHDIGRRDGFSYLRHVIDGYRHLHDRDPSAARICLTHSFPLANLATYQGKIDVNDEDRQFLEGFLGEVRYDFFDEIVQLGDSMATDKGFVRMEVRWVDVSLRYGINTLTVDKWRMMFALRDTLNRRYGIDIEGLLGV